jgi:hypothetical protein
VNFQPIISPFAIYFAADQTDAAFTMVTNEGTSTFTARLNGAVVDSFSARTSTDGSYVDNYFGFTRIVFNEIDVDVGGFNQAMTLDNLQTGPAASSAVPEPAGLTLLGIGAACALGYAWRRRKRAVA